MDDYTPFWIVFWIAMCILCAWLGYASHPDSVIEKVPFIVEYQNTDCFLEGTNEQVERLSLADVEEAVE